MFFITDQRPDRFVVRSEANAWVVWLAQNIPANIHRDIRLRLSSNIKHLIVGLELKAALIQGHRHRGPGERNVLFEPYYNNLILEFCVGAFSVLEGLGSVHWLDQQGRDGTNAQRIPRAQWRPALCTAYDPADDRGLDAGVERVLQVRDKLHQDQLGARTAIDWHALSYEQAFIPAARAVRTLLLRNPESVPVATNLTADPG